MKYLFYVWNYLLYYPISLFELYTGVHVPPVLVFLVKVALVLLLVYLLVALVQKALNFRLRPGGHSSLVDMADVRALEAHRSGLPLAKAIETAHNLDATIAPLKKSRDFAAMGEVYASVNQHKKAAKYFAKAGRRRQAAIETAKAGNPLKAAKLLLKEGDFAEAARYFAEEGVYREAAKAYLRAGQYALGAAAYAMAQNYGEAADIYATYFASASDSVEVQIAAADECLKMLNSEPGRARVSPGQRGALLPAIASRFEQAHRYDQAATLLKECGDPARAGEVYLLAGKLEEAAACMKLAGKDKEAARIVGRYHQNKGNWREAATAFAQAGDYLGAGEMFAKAADAVRSGECFEKAGEFYRAGFAYAHAARYEQAIRVLQKVREAHPSFDQSRALLGRCFYELHDYTHCAAALDNHLTGKRIDTQNMDYFYMLALAYEQLGRLDESREIFYKIRTVNVGYRDVAQRISSISSRISLAAHASPAPASATSPAVHAAPAADTAAATRVMESVESNLGGRYVLEKELGRGGMGVVYLARDSQLDRPVALKFLGSIIDSNDEFRERFVREARTAAKISHPNIISIYDISATAGKAYIAMEYIDGPSLHRYLKQRGKLTPREAVNLIVQSCSALAAIHEVGIVHRDIKPDNILVAKGGLVKLTDFGLAKAEDSRMTRTGVVMGTPSYMSPEQVLGRDADQRSDIYSLGLVLHECLTGDTVFAGPDVLERQLKETPSAPGHVTQGVPQELDSIIMKAIAKNPDERYQTVRDFMVDLRALSL